MNFEAEILEETYSDTFTVERSKKIKNPNTGVTETILVKIYENVKGALSKNDNQLVNSGDTGISVYNHKLFHNNKYEILKGDIVTVNRYGKISSYLASDGFIDISHTETMLTKKERF